MRKHTAVKRLSALALALIMALPLALPAMADGVTQEPPYQINIRPNKYTSTPGDLEDEIKAQDDFSSYETCLAWAEYHADDGENDPLGKLALEYINLVQRFKAFQIFSGNIDPGNYEQPNMPSDNTSIGSLPANALANVEWGNSIAENQRGPLLYALMTSDTLAKDAGIQADAEALSKSPYDGITNRDSEFDYDTLTLGDLFSAVLKEEGYTVGTGTVTSATDSDLSKAAALVAKVLSDFTPSTAAGNPALARVFARIVTRKDTDGENYLYLNNENKENYTSSWNGNQWTIGNSGGGSDAPLQGGYYLFTDTYDESHYGHKDKAQSELILGVFGTVNMTVEASAPSVDKGIVDENNMANKGDTAEIGDTVTFRLTGTLPENYDTAYDKYKYIFHDTLSKGLTYGSVSQVYVKVYDEKGAFGTGEDGDLKYDIYVIDTGANGYQEKKGDDAKHTKDGVTTQHTVDFDFGDLKKLQGKKAAGIDSVGGYTTGDGTDYVDVPITSSSEIYVEYTATLNENAAVGYNENYNEVVLEYSDNPENSEETNTSTGSRSYVYTFGVEILKYDGSIEEDEPADNPLENVGFALTKNGGKWYPYFDSDDAAEPVGWISEADVLAYLGTSTVDEKYADTTGDLEALPAAGGTTNFPAAGKYIASIGEDAPAAKDDMTLYALLKKVDGNPKGHYAIAGWVPEVDLVDILDQPEKDGKISDTEWADAIAGDKVAAYINEGFTTSDSYVLAIKTDENGYLRIEGMDSDITYYLREVITPSGFDTIDPVGIQFTATYFTAEDLEDTGAGYSEDAAAGYLKDLSYSVNNGEQTYIVKNGKYTDPDGETGAAELSAKLEVPNYPAGYLPGTGGRGVYLFYIGGGVLLVGAVLFLVLSGTKRKPGKRVRYISRQK